MLREVLKKERGILINLYEDEHIFNVVRKHWYTFIGTIIITVIVIILFSIASFFVFRNLGGNHEVQISKNLIGGVMVIFGPIFLLSIMGFFYIMWLDYYLDIFILTNKRILRFEQLVLFGQKISETSYQHVQDVSSRIGGFFQTLLNIGTVYVETAGEKENFSFGVVKNPNSVAADILELQKKTWESEGNKSDLANERKHEKIKKMNHDIGNLLVEEAGLEENKTNSFSPESVEKSEEKEIIPEVHSEKETKEEIKSFNPESIFETAIGAAEEEKKVEGKVEEKIFSSQNENYKDEHYKDGRKIIPHGVIWQADQELTDEVLEILNKMEG